MSDSDLTDVEVLVSENHKRITLVRSQTEGQRVPSFRYEVAMAPVGDDGEWTERYFDTYEQARDWANNIEKNRDRARRQSYRYPVTLKVSKYRTVSYIPAFLKGLRATDGEWKVEPVTKARGFDVKSARGSDIYQQMPHDDRERMEFLEAEIMSRESELSDLKIKHKLDLPHTGIGRVSVDRAIEADNRMAEIFERLGVENQQLGGETSD